MSNYRFAVVPALLALVAFLLAANLFFGSAAVGQTPRPPKVTSYLMQVRNDFRSGATFAAAPGYRVTFVIPCNGAGGAYGQGSDLCMIERQEH